MMDKLTAEETIHSDMLVEQILAEARQDRRLFDGASVSECWNLLYAYFQRLLQTFSRQVACRHRR